MTEVAFMKEDKKQHLNTKYVPSTWGIKNGLYYCETCHKEGASD